MARALPIYQRQFLGTGVQSAPTARSPVSGNSPVAAALGNIANQVASFAGQMSREQENNDAMQVSNFLSTSDAEWQKTFTERARGWSVGSDPLDKTIETEFDKWTNESEQKFASKSAKDFFRKNANAMKSRLLTNAVSYQDKATTSLMNAQTDAGIQADSDTVYNDPARMDEVYARRVETIIARTDLTEAEKITASLKYKQGLALAAERGEMERDPSGWYRKRFGATPVERTADAPGVTGKIDSTVIANAIYGQESSNGKADTSKVNAQDVTGPMQIQRGTFDGMKKLGIIPESYDWQNPEQNKDAGFKWVDYLSKKYDGDPAKVAAAYYAGEKAVGDDGKIKRHYRNLKRPQDPTVGEYVDQVMGRINKGGGMGVPTAAAPRSYRNIDWQQQAQLREAAEAKIKQEDTRVMAGIVSIAAGESVMAQDIGTSLSVDLEQAKVDAITRAEKAAGRVLDETQKLQVEAAVEREALTRERQRKRDQDNVTTQLFDALDQNGGDYLALQKTMAEKFDMLPRADRDRVQKYAGMVATGETRPTDWTTYGSLVENQKLLASTNLAAIKDRFANSDYQQLVTLQQKVLKAQEEGMPDQTIQSDMSVVKSLLDDAGVKDKAKQAQFYSVLQREMDARRMATGQKVLKQEEVKSIAADLLIKEVTSRGILWDNKEMAYNLEVPAVERAKITAALQDQGLPVNESTILRLYRNKLQRANPPQTVAVSPIAPPVAPNPLIEQIPR